MIFDCRLKIDRAGFWVSITNRQFLRTRHVESGIDLFIREGTAASGNSGWAGSQRSASDRDFWGATAPRLCQPQGSREGDCGVVSRKRSAVEFRTLAALCRL